MLYGLDERFNNDIYKDVYFLKDSLVKLIDNKVYPFDGEVDSNTYLKSQIVKGEISGNYYYIGDTIEVLAKDILGAAIIDDVIGIVVLTAVLGMKDPSANLGSVCIKTVAFFVLSVVVGFFIFKIMKVIDKKWPHTRRIPIIGMTLAFILAYVADKYFGVADITGAYVAGIILSSLDDSEYIDRKMDINSYMIFGPVFFASVGLQTNLRTVDMTILAFSVAFVIVGLLGKVIGCSLVSKLLKYNNLDSLKIGVGMMTRGEVALIVAQRGLKAEILDGRFFTAVILLIVVSSILTPIILKAIYAMDDKKLKKS
jgi:Kef-type K+ transport system membrane component KefB